MRIRLFSVVALLGALLLESCYTRIAHISSPDKNIRVSVSDSIMTVRYGGKVVQTIRIGDNHWTESSRIVETVEERYTMLSGKRRECTYKYRAMSCRDAQGKNLLVRVSNDGVAFRFNGADEHVSFVIPDGTRRWLQRQKTDYEGFYPESSQAADGKYSYPALVEYADGMFGLITESGINHGNSCSYLTCSGDGYTVTYTDNDETDVHAWRILMLGSLADIVESTLVTDVASGGTLTDKSWIKPGVSSWIYWAYNHSSKDFQKVKEYIDLAHDMGWPYTLSDWEWDEMANGGAIEDAMAYARERGVKVNLWYNSGTSWIGPGAPGPQDRLRTREAREREMTRLEQMGATGIKVDFFLPDGHEMVDYYLDILEDAARHHLLVDFHGCTIPRGWSRTWPNLMSMEAVYGAEWYNNNRRMTNAAAAHNATLPFTRNVIGPMDYTPCTFTDSQNPHITTDCHELALPILFESGLQHMADRPEAYLNLPEQVRSLLSGLPSAWDDTRLLAGYPGKSAVIARRSGDTWYIAGINGTEGEIILEPDFSRIGQDVTLSMLITDKGDKPGMGFDIQNKVQAGKIVLPARGGFVAIF
ncbi:MAG: glycoside hydrolase family 97 catalytic domain-containing protein [Bacteroidaceae bacterium]|nr:glycoside hydrolase family 97 catalytic domain-containing protein [Bacteroidaceae bacterium]